MNDNDILYWPRTAHIGIVQVDSQNRRYDLAKWKDYDFNAANYEENVRQGLYNTGIALRLGKCIKPFQDRHIFAFDFDGWHSVVLWFGEPGETDEQIWDKVLQMARETRIEWHNNRGRLHMLFFADEPVRKTRIQLDQALLELRYDELLSSSPSINADGFRWTPLGTKEIQHVNVDDLMKLRNKMDSLVQYYISDANKEEYTKWLEDSDNWKSIGIGEGRHLALLRLGVNYFWRYKGEWKNYDNEQRLEKLLAKNQEFTEPKSEQEVRALWDWIVKTHRVKRDLQFEEWDKVRHSHWGYTGEYQTGPYTYIGGTADNRLIEFKLVPADSEEANQQGDKIIDKDTEAKKKQRTEVIPSPKKTFLALKPVRIIKHDYRLSWLIADYEQKYTIEFRGMEKSACFTVRQKTKAQIVNIVKDFALTEYGIDVAINAQILGFEKEGRLEVDDEISYDGFFLDKDGKIFASHIEIQEPDKIALTAALDVIEQAVKFYPNRVDLFATSIKWGIVAPLSFVIKSKDRFLKWLHFSGTSNTSKSTCGIFILALDGHDGATSKFTRPFTSIDTIARMESLISETTFPKLINEVEISPYDNTRHAVNNIKVAVESIILRSKFVTNKSIKAEDKPALTPLILTGNPGCPQENAYMKRVLARDFSVSEVFDTRSQNSVEFRRFLAENLSKLAALGNFRNWFIMNSQETILSAIEKKDMNPMEIGRNLLRAAYGFVDRQIPDWTNELLSETQLEESLLDNTVLVKSAFEKYLQATFRNSSAMWQRIDKDELKGILNEKLSARLALLIDAGELPDIKRRPDGKIAISKGLLAELYKYGITNGQLPNLRVLADYTKGQYTSYHGYRVVLCDSSQLNDYVDKLPGE